jgi:hypothetical protein
MNRPIFIALVVCAVVGCAGGCSTEHSEAVKQLAFVHEGESFFVPYLTGNAEQARQSLKQTIQFFEESNILDPSGQADILTLDYDRLYVLEKRTGNKSGAEVALIKARYWRIRGLELNKLSDDEAVNAMMLDTPEKIVRRVDDFDKGANNGNEPKYLEYITNSPSE